MMDLIVMLGEIAILLYTVAVLIGFAVFAGWAVVQGVRALRDRITGRSQNVGIWWCEEHEQNGCESECNFYRQCQPARGDCRMVQMRLVADAAPSPIWWCLERRAEMDFEGSDAYPMKCRHNHFHYPSTCRMVQAAVILTLADQGASRETDGTD